MNRSETARENFKNGYNCSQSVFLAFSDLIPLDEKTALKISAPLGGGVGRMREVCGTVSAMMMICGLVFYDAEHVTLEEKSALYAREQELARRFREKGLLAGFNIGARRLYLLSEAQEIIRKVCRGGKLESLNK